MTTSKKPIQAAEIPLRATKSIYPAPFSSRMEGRSKRQLGNYFGIQKFGVNMTHLLPNAESALLHRHSKQEEFIYVLSGHPTLILGSEEIQLSPGMCMGFCPGEDAHKIVNRSTESVTYLEVGDRELGDLADYPADDLIAEMESDGKWAFRHKNGVPY